MKKQIYLVTGAAGLLGSNITRKLIERGDRVKALVLNRDPAIKHVPKEAQVVFGDITDNESLERFFKIKDDDDIIVIHCASIVTVDPDYNKKVYEVNVQGTKNIVDKCVKHKVKKLVYISSTSAIPELPEGQVIKEVTSFSPKGIIGHYGQTKAEASEIVMNAVREKNLDASIVFPTGICGPNDFAYGPVSTFIVDYVKGKMPAGVAGYFNAVDVRDLADGVIACCERGRKGEGYIMGNELVSMRQMFDLLSELTGCKNVKTIIPIKVANILAAFADKFNKIKYEVGNSISYAVYNMARNYDFSYRKAEVELAYSVRPYKVGKLTSFAVYNMARNNDFSYRKAEIELGYKVRPFKDSMADEITWLRNEGKI